MLSYPFNVYLVLSVRLAGLNAALEQREQWLSCDWHVLRRQSLSEWLRPELLGLSATERLLCLCHTFQPGILHSLYVFICNMEMCISFLDDI